MRQDLQESIYRKYPEWIVLIATCDRHGRYNVMPAGWSMFTSHEPPLYAVSVGLTRYTHDVIMETEEFVVAVPTAEMARDIRHSGTNSGPDKLAHTSFDLVPGEKVKAPLINGSLANLECKLHSAHRTGDHTIFVGEIVKGHYAGERNRRLMNFGNGLYAVAQPDPHSQFRFR